MPPNSRTQIAKGNKIGRPQAFLEEERRELILQAAEKVFTTTGYGASTMEEIAQAAGMAKKTLYSFYSDKKTLLIAVFKTADDFPWKDDNDCTSLADPVAELRRRLLVISEFAFTQRQICLTRLLIAEVTHLPSELSDDFHERVILKSRLYVEAAIKKILSSQNTPFALKDSKILTRVVLGAVGAELHLGTLLGKFKEFDRKKINAHIDIALKVFCPITSGSEQPFSERSMNQTFLWRMSK